MPDQFSGTSALADQVKAAYDRKAMFALRAGGVFDQFARVKPGNVTSPGDSVSFLFWADLAPATAALAETIDVDAVALSDSLVTITPAEHGNAILTTVRVKANTYLLSFDADASNIVNYNMVDSLERIAEAGLRDGDTETAIHTSGAASNTASDILTLDVLRRRVAAMRSANVAPIAGENFAVILHPHVSYDLMTATASTDWSAFVQRQPGSAGEWKTGQIAQAAGLSFIESSRARIDLDGGASAVDNYYTYVLGQDAFGKAESIPAHIVPGPITDKLMRFRPLGWHAYLGYKAIRADAAQTIVSASSLGTNT